jgi:hypothetical protein
MSMQKQCLRCKRKKPVQAFQKNVTSPDGFRSQCKKCQANRTPKVKPPRFFRPLKGRRYIITAAQNATPIDVPFFETLKVAAKHLGATLVVVPLRYKNPTSVWSGQQEDQEWWAEETKPYLFNVRKKLGPNLVLCGDVKIQPTASAPLIGFQSLTGAESCILGHPKMQFLSVPVPHGRLPKILTTTGACTLKNYTDSKAGKIGAFHHFLGAIMVELRGKKFNIRQINADRQDGSFIELDLKFTSKGVQAAPPALGLIMGDIHTRYICPKVDRATFGPKGIVETLNPKTLVVHDVIDGDTVNPHTVGNPFLAAARKRNVRAEVEQVVAFLNSRAKGRDVIVVDSNHHDWLARWIIRGDWKSEGPNAEFYLESALAMLRSAHNTPSGSTYSDPFPYWAKRLGAEGNIRFLNPDESFTLGGNECGMHGHRGPNGSRGTLQNLSRLGAKVISGHTHTPGIQEGHYQVGTSTPLRLQYNRGPSSWLNTHCVVYANGKRSLITIVDGSWRV